MDVFNPEYVSLFDSDFFPNVFMNLPCGAALIQLLLDESGTPVDYVTLEVNTHFLKVMRKTRDSVIGKKARSLLTEDELAHWLDVFTPVALHRQKAMHAMYTNHQKHKYNVLTVSPRRGYICLIFSEDTDYNSVSARHHIFYS